MLIGSMILEYVNDILWVLEQVRIFVYYSYIQVNTWKYGWSYSPGIIQSNQCSSHGYSQETLFIPVLFIEDTNTILKYFYYSYQHYSLFVLSSYSSYFLSFFP